MSPFLRQWRLVHAGRSRSALALADQVAANSWHPRFRTRVCFGTLSDLRPCYGKERWSGILTNHSARAVMKRPDSV
jgi:hypothetical protein